MKSDTLNLWGQGAITLPKAWRDKYPTTNYLAVEQSDGSLVIKPILDDVVYYEEDGHVGLRFPYGIAADDLLSAVDAEVQKRKKRVKSHTRTKKRG